MTPEPTHPTTATPVERRGAIWPWLLLPLVALALFFALNAVQRMPGSGQSAPSAESPTTSEDAGSP